MTREEGAALAAALMANWPGARVGQATVSLYARKLERVDYDVGKEAVSRVIDRETYWPPVAVLLGACREVREERAREEAETRGLSEPPLTPEQARDNARRVRELAASIGREVEDDADSGAEA